MTIQSRTLRMVKPRTETNCGLNNAADKRLSGDITHGRTRFSLLATRQNRFEMRRLFFAGDDANLNFFESRPFQPMMQIAFHESQPAVPIKLAGFFEFVPGQIEHPKLPAGA